MEGQEVARSALEVLFFCVCLEDIIPKSLSISSVKPQVKFFIMEISEKAIRIPYSNERSVPY